MADTEQFKGKPDEDVVATEGPYGPTETQRIIGDDFTWYRFAAEQVNYRMPESVSIEETTEKPGEIVATYPVDSLFIPFAHMGIAIEKMVASTHADKFGPYVRPEEAASRDANPESWSGWREEKIRMDTESIVEPFFRKRLTQQIMSSNPDREMHADTARRAKRIEPWR